MPYEFRIFRHRRDPSIAPIGSITTTDAAVPPELALISKVELQDALAEAALKIIRGNLAENITINRGQLAYLMLALAINTHEGGVQHAIKTRDVGE